MSDKRMPAVALAAMPGRRRATIEFARELEKRNFSGIYCASFADGMGLCEALALTTEHIRFGTAIVNIYTRHVTEYAQSASFIHELSNGRFHFGVGVSHEVMNRRMGLATGKPLADMRRFIAEWKAVPRAGELPPIVLAALRDPMVKLAGELGDGVVFANVARSHMGHSLGLLPPAKRNDPAFFIGNMIPTCISDDREAAAAVNRRTLSGYVTLPHYRAYWRSAGYVAEMDAIEKALAAGDRDSLPSLLPDHWLADTTLFGSASEVREGVEAWLDAGVRTLVLVPSSTSGGQMKALEELLAAFA